MDTDFRKIADYLIVRLKEAREEVLKNTTVGMIRREARSAVLEEVKEILNEKHVGDDWKIAEIESLLHLEEIKEKK